MTPELGDQPKRQFDDDSRTSNSNPKSDSERGLEEAKVPKVHVEEPGQRRSGASVAAWHPDVQLRSPGLGTDSYLDSTKPQGSAASHSTVVNDHGDAKYLAESRASGQVRSANESRGLGAGNELNHVGAGFANATDHLGEPKDIDLLIQGTTASEGNAREGQEDETSDAETLGESIRAACMTRAGKEKGKEFLPRDALDSIITRERVRMELARSNQVDHDRLDHYADKVWEVTSPSPTGSTSKKTTRMKIFAILALMDKVEDIVHFVEEGLHDNNLPFILSKGARRGLRQLDRKEKDGSLHPIRLFEKWPIHSLESFYAAQWRLLAPYFHFSTKEDPKVSHYPLENRIILPFIEDNEVRSAGGGYSDVWQVKIHPAHHNGCEDTAPETKNPSYAVKRLRHHNGHDSDVAFKIEASNLKRFSGKDHLHLIKLLVTFSWREQYYFLFPWADGNLQDFWKTHPSPSTPKRNYRLASWFSKQCLGIAEGLKMIHTADLPNEYDQLSTGHQIHGRHGDLKPENILWFAPYHNTDESCYMGVLKITDFGLTQFHRTRSKSHVDASGMSPTYRAPEYDVAKKVSQSYDMWTLGCVFLEFVTWYLLGWDEVDQFSKDRTMDDRSEIPEDVFFNLVNIKANGRTQTGARAKRSVANEFQKLCKEENCSDFILEFLDLIETKLLRMDPNKRYGCEELVELLTRMHKRCLEDETYCSHRTSPAPIRRRTDLSELCAAPLEYSVEQEKRNRRNTLPDHNGIVESDVDSHDAEPNGSQGGSEQVFTTEKIESGSTRELTKGMGSTSKFGAVRTASPSSFRRRDSQTSRPQTPNRKDLKVRFRDSHEMPELGELGGQSVEPASTKDGPTVTSDLISDEPIMPPVLEGSSEELIWRTQPGSPSHTAGQTFLKPNEGMENHQPQGSSINDRTSSDRQTLHNQEDGNETGGPPSSRDVPVDNDANEGHNGDVKARKTSQKYSNEAGSGNTTVSSRLRKRFKRIFLWFPCFGDD